MCVIGQTIATEATAVFLSKHFLGIWVQLEILTLAVFIAVANEWTATAWTAADKGIGQFDGRTAHPLSNNGCLLGDFDADLLDGVELSFEIVDDLEAKPFDQLDRFAHDRFANEEDRLVIDGFVHIVGHRCRFEAGFYVDVDDKIVARELFLGIDPVIGKKAHVFQ